MTAPALRSSRFFATVALLVVLFAGVWPQDAEAQTEWRQRFQVITPVQENTVASALRDSLVDVVRREGLDVRRSPEDETARPLREIEDELLSEGVDFTSANRVFLRYDFQAERGDLKRKIGEMYFIYRPEGSQGNDTPILAVDGSEPAIANLLVNSGMKLRTNEAAFTAFREQLMFNKLPESQLVSLGGEVIRDPQKAEAERRRLLRTVQRFLY